MSDQPESWDYIQVLHLSTSTVDYSAGRSRVLVSGDWSYPQDNFESTELTPMLGWLGKAGWELVAVTQANSRDGGMRQEEETAYMRRPTRFAASP